MNTKIYTWKELKEKLNLENKTIYNAIIGEKGIEFVFGFEE